ncbi:hypothetical protein BOX15_Mlig031348g1 [Macrostomum lignano]|uniref:DUF1722 domain-containing protein n=1 Tax=Macrostomum lignano TaxID=282301 RepID=A0A267GGI5_9PLAT|nr:hypothetical protein BOX15_Mlig031348g1 [Macrostomum lignano]
MVETLDQLECHFTWRPDEESTKVNIEDVIKTTERKINREPHKKVAYLTTLAYLHTQKMRVDFVRAQELLDEARRIDAQIQSDNQTDLHVSSEYVIRADVLHLKKMRGNTSKKFQKREEDVLAQELRELSSLWNDNNKRAQVFGVKGVTFDCFGPKKYAIGVEAFSRAKEIQPENFYWLYGEAFLKARCNRQTAKKQADSELLELWRTAREIGEKKNLTTSIFYANYAEAILHNVNHELCCQLVEKATDMFLQSPKSFKEHSFFMYVVCAKIFRHLNWRTKESFDQQRKALLDDVKSSDFSISDSGFYLEMAGAACEIGSTDEAVRLLKKGQEVAAATGNLWIELKLLELQSESLGKDKSVAHFDSLRQIFSMYNKDVAAILFSKALYLMKQGDTDEAIESCIAAVEAQSSLEMVFYAKKQAFFEDLFRLQEGREEYLAWFASLFGTFKKKLDIESLYRTALERDEGNEFALEHLGRFLMKNRNFDAAVDCFRKLPDEHESKNKLLAQSLLENPEADLKHFQECLECGCRDAAPRIFDILERRKSEQKTAERVMADASPSAQAGKDPLFFRRELYELCAKIELTIDDSNSFVIETESDLDDLRKSVKLRIAEFLELNLLTSKAGSTRSAEGAGDRGNLMRSNRFLMTKLQMKETGREVQEMNNMIVSVLKEAKEVLDRSLAVRLKGSGREFSYPHAFGQFKKQLEGDYKRQFNQLSSETERKAFELESLMKLLKKDTVTLENVRKCLLEESKRIDKDTRKNFPQSRDTRDIFNFMVSREHRILSSEDSWIVRWVYLVNNEKHSTEILVKELNQQLKSDWSGGGVCRKTAYDVAHLAAEFAEETWAVFSNGVRAGEATGVQSGEAAGVQASEATVVQAGEATGDQAGEATGVQAGEATGVQAGEATGVQAGEATGVQAGEATD